MDEGYVGRLAEESCVTLFWGMGLRPFIRLSFRLLGPQAGNLVAGTWKSVLLRLETS